MTSRRLLTFWLLLSFGTVCLAPAPASAWWRRAQRRNVLPTEPTEESVTLKGVIQRVTPGQIEVLVDSPAKADQKAKNKNAPHGIWAASTPRSTEFQVEGEATPNYLRSGLLVQFSAKVEGREIKEPIHELTIISRARGTTHVASAESKPVSKDNGPNATPLGSESSKIVGQLGHTQGNKWLVHVGDKSYRIELADDLAIKVALSNRHVISAGDKIVIHGKAIHGKPGACIADDVEVTLAHPLSGKSKPKSSEHEPAPGRPEAQ
jgi:hypothetical protein